MATHKAPLLRLQFHITGRCNLNCKHCYRTEGDVEKLSLSDVINVLEQFKALLAKHSPHRGHVNLTGGEPFIRADIKDILAYMGENRDSFTYGVLSNGSFIDDGMIALLKETWVIFVQLSLDGDRKTHDALRAEGDYDRVLKTAKRLEKKGITTYISFTANKDNYRHLPKVAKECRKRNITKLWSDRLVPIGKGLEIDSLTITDKELPDYLAALKKAEGGALAKLIYPVTQVSANRALQFLGCNGALYACSAGKTLITVDEFGNIMPCRRMPVICGNAFESSLCEVYFNNETFKKLRTDGIPKECDLCKYAPLCRGGAKCQSYAAYGSFTKADPACFLKKE